MAYIHVAYMKMHILRLTGFILSLGGSNELRLRLIIIKLIGVQFVIPPLFFRVAINCTPLNLKFTKILTSFPTLTPRKQTGAVFYKSWLLKYSGSTLTLPNWDDMSPNKEGVCSAFSG